MRLLFAAAATIAFTSPAFASPAFAEDPDMSGNGDLTFEQVFASPSLNGPAPRGVKLSPDGRYLTLLRNRANDKDRYDLWGYDRQAEQWSMLVDSEKLGSGRELSEDEKMQRERQRIGNLSGIVTYQWTADSAAMLVPLDGDLYLAGLDGSVRRLTDTEASELNPGLSPRSTYLSFVRDRQLWIGLTGEEARPVTPAESELIRWGEAEFVAQEEMGRLTGYWWSPNDDRIAVQRTDESPVGVVTRAAIGAAGTKVFDQRYPAAGSNNALVQLFVMNPDGSGVVEVDLGPEPDIYLARVDWAPDGSALYVQRQNRGQTVLDMLRVDPETGASEILFTEQAAAQDYWINLSDNYKFLKDGSLIWWSERSGFGHFYRFSGGEWTPLTAGDWAVTGLVGVNEDAGLVYFTGNRDDVLAQAVYQTDLATPGTVTRITDAGWSAGARMDKTGRTLLVTRSNETQPPQTYLADGAGKMLAWVEENALDASHPYSAYLSSHAAPEYGTIKAADGVTDLHWMMIKPRMEAGKKYPVLFSHYGGPGPQTVNRDWDGALPQAIADQGYIYFQIDNRGSANRGVAFEQPIYRAMGSVEVADQKAGAQFLKSLDFVDPGKIALYGWSYGGYMTLKQLQADPGLYAAGVSGAPVTRWELYDTHYTERYMGDPREVPEAYASAGAIADAGKITDPLLLIHGMADDNVIFENSSELIAKLQGRNRPFEMMLYPGYTHRVSGEQISPHLWNTIFGFLARNGVAPPERAPE